MCGVRLGNKQVERSNRSLRHAQCGVCMSSLNAKIIVRLCPLWSGQVRTRSIGKAPYHIAHLIIYSGVVGQSTGVRLRVDLPSFVAGAETACSRFWPRGEASDFPRHVRHQLPQPESTSSAQVPREGSCTSSLNGLGFLNFSTLVKFGIAKLNPIRQHVM